MPTLPSGAQTCPQPPSRTPVLKHPHRHSHTQTCLLLASNSSPPSSCTRMRLVLPFTLKHDLDCPPALKHTPDHSPMLERASHHPPSLAAGRQDATAWARCSSCLCLC